MEFTGERLIPGIPRLENMIIEELGRLNLAKNSFQNAASALDFGCGTGYAANFMLEQGATFVTGIDISAEAIRFAQNRYGRPGLSYAQMNCLNTAFQSQSFEFICSLDTIEHFSESGVHQFLGEIVRLLKPGGSCLITTPNKLHTSPYGNPSWEFHHKEFFYDELQTLLNQYFSQVEIYRGSVPVYEDRWVRKITDSSLSQIKHFLPSKARVGFSSTLRYWLKSDLQISDVKISQETVEQGRVFVAMCWK